MHYVLLVSRDRPEARKRAIDQLGHCYHDLLEDWARAAHWLGKVEGQNILQVISLADCYWKLGSKSMAARELGRIRTDFTRYGSAIKLWSDMGELPRALALASSTASSGRKDAAYMAAGDACRKHGRFREAIAYYRQVLDLPGRGKDDILKKNKDRARINIDTIRVYDALDLKKIGDGVYEGTSLSYNGDLTVAVTIQGGRISSVRIIKHNDKQYYTALTDTPRQIVQKQSLKDVDATTGATITAEAVVNATGRALSSGLR